MTLDDLVPRATTRAVAELGLHKVAGAMFGIPDMTLPAAVQVLGTHAYLRRKEARAIADGIAAFAVVTDEKIAASPVAWELLKRSLIPAAAGAGIATVPHLLSNDPMQPPSSPIPAMGIGALLGTIGSAAHDIHALPAPMAQEVVDTLRNMHLR